MSAFRVRLSTSAAAALRALGSRPRGMLIIALATAAAWEPRGGLLNIWVADELAACEVIARDRLVLVYAIRSRSSVNAALYGEELLQRLRRLGIRRAIHGRRGRL
jgi:hypothetical protein